MRLFSWLPLFFLLQYSLCGQQDPVPLEPGSLTVVAIDAGGDPIAEVAIRLGGVLQTQLAPATFAIDPGLPVLVAVSRPNYAFSPAEASITLSAGETDTLRFLGSGDPAQLTVLAEDPAGAAIPGVAIRLDGTTQLQTAPLTLALVPEQAYLLSAEHPDWSFAPVDTSVTLSAGTLATLRFRGSEIPRRLVIVEDFTNVNCPNCPEADEAVWAAVEAASSEALPLFYHVWWPAGGDPFYIYGLLNNSNLPMPLGLAQQRVSFYGVSATPRVSVDGVKTSDDFDSQVTLAAIEAGLAQAPVLAMTVAYAGGASEVVVTGAVTGAPGPGPWRLYVLIYETEVVFLGGSNGQTLFRNTVRHANAASGVMGVPVDLVPGGEFGTTFSFTPGAAAVLANLRAVAFVQNPDTKVILDAATAAPGGP
ncbi:hypothetical protein FJ251_05400 [bacterium]|nr:hypothetical protein [bacterium]